jgi:hypothetical protein
MSFLRFFASPTEKDDKSSCAGMSRMKNLEKRMSYPKKQPGPLLCASK